MKVSYHKNRTVQITVNIITLFSLIFGFFTPAVAAPEAPISPTQAEHGVKVSAIFCKVVGSVTVKLSGVVESWATGSAGENPSVDVSYKAVYADNSTGSGFVVNDGFNSGNNYKFPFSKEIQSLAENPVTSIDAIVEVKADWKDSSTNRPVIYEPAAFVGDCPDEPMKTPTAEPVTATPTKTLTPTATPTKTRTPTATPTPTKVTVWDQSVVSVTVECVVGYTLFRITNIGKSMTGETEWQLLVNNVPVKTGTYNLAANQEVKQIYAPGQYTGELTLIVSQRLGYPGALNVQASMKSDACVNTPTSDPEIDELADITIRKIEGDSSPTSSVYYVECLPSRPSNKDIIIEILVTFTDGTPSDVRKGKYCDSRIYIDGSVELVAIVGAVADPVGAFPTPASTPNASGGKTVYLPVVVR